MSTPYMGVFASMPFPPYRFVEYPKWIHFSDRPSVLVHSQSEEIGFLAENRDAASALNVPESIEKVRLQRALEEQRNEMAKMERELRELRAKAEGGAANTISVAVDAKPNDDDPSQPVPLKGSAAVAAKLGGQFTPQPPRVEPAKAK